MNKLTSELFPAIFLLFGFCNLAISQEIEVSASKPDVLSNLISMHNIIGHDQDHFYVIKYIGSQYFLEKLDKELNTINEEALKLFKGIKAYDLEALIHFHDELYLFASHLRFNEITLYYQKLDKNTLLPTTELIEVTTVEFIKGNYADFHFALSRHETKLLIACRIKLVLTGAQFNEYYVFGENLSLIWKRKDAFTFNGQGPRDNKYIVDETGNVSILSLLKRESIGSLFGEVKNMYAIYRYTDDGNSFKEYPLTLPDLYIRGLRIIGNERGELICAGLYSELYKAGIRGTFFFRIDDKTGQIIDHNLNKFDDAVLSELVKMKDPIMRDEELMHYVISDMVLRENGRIIIIAEQVFNQSYHNYNNLIVTCYDVSGQVYWTRVVRKKQSFNYTSIAKMEMQLSDYRGYIRETGFLNLSLENYCSYALMAPLDRTGIILFYNDDVKNMNTSGLMKAFASPRKSYIKAVAIDEFGNLSEKSLIKWKKKALFPAPMRYYDTLSDTIVIPAFRIRFINYFKIVAGVFP